MIDAEVKIFNRVYGSVAPLCANNKFVSTQVVSPTAFPAASLIEIGNTTLARRQGTSLIENFAIITYQLDVYALSKSKCREVYSAADDAMIGLNFNRISGQYIDNPDNTKVFRYVARYEALIDPEGNLYRAG